MEYKQEALQQENKQKTSPINAEDIFLLETYLAGTSYIIGLADLAKYMQIDDKVDLYLEENNEYDQNAVYLEYDQLVKIGYLARENNLIFARLLKAGKRLYGKIKKLDCQASYVKIAIDIYLAEK